MFSPGAVIFSARAVLFMAAVAAAVLMLGPFSGAERLFLLTDKEAHVTAFFVLTALSFVAAPRMRRNDLALAAIALGVAAEIAQACVGRDGNIPDLMADSLGVLFAWAPSQAQAFRRRVQNAAFRERRAKSRKAMAAVGIIVDGGPEAFPRLEAGPSGSDLRLPQPQVSHSPARFRADEDL